ncbi:C-type mannose receptor 2-like [Notolabrus celidotus]|uniref:C-type mannose receptor 2-like n=1 Tax=Notolabrus celidotus TaxID=1203425 RepID=UPI00148FC582|nr:C-type mannose receptor 2-like [Notolabrus celidotus]
MTPAALCTIAPRVKRRYHFYYEHKNRDEALTFCREKHTDLATITTMDDMNTLRGMADLGKMVHWDFSFRAWIGLYDDVESWRWSLSDPSFYDPGEAGFTRWSAADRVNSRKLCTTMNMHGGWDVASCTERFKSVCCNVTGPNVTFDLIPTDMTWTEAQSYCREHYTDLASVRNMAENQKIQSLVPFLQKAWIGFSRESWKWADGSNSSMRNWNPGLSEPNNLFSKESCVSADFGNFGKWEDWPCGYKRAFVCHTAGISKQVFRLSVQKKDPSLDLNDPAVTDDILEQIKQKLKDGGLDENIKLSWRKQPGGNVFQKLKTEEEEEKKKDEDDLECRQEDKMLFFL